MITYNEFQKALKIVNGYETQLETHLTSPNSGFAAGGFSWFNDVFVSIF